LWMLDDCGQKLWVPLKEVPGDSYGFGQIEPYLEERELIRHGRIGRARVRLMPGQALIDAVVAFLSKEPDGLLCHRPGCEFCNWARQFVSAGGSELGAEDGSMHWPQRV
jgi:hypothetical protein